MAGWGSYYARSMDEELGTEYSPDLLTKKPILLSPYLLSVVAKAECEYSRADERVSLGANKEAVREFLINLESLAAAAMNGDSINLVDLLTANIVPETPEKGRTGGAPVPRARLYKQLIKKHSDPKAAKAVHFDRDFVFALHAELCGASPDDRRHWAYRGAQAGACQTRCIPGSRKSGRCRRTASSATWTTCAASATRSTIRPRCRPACRISR